MEQLFKRIKSFLTKEYVYLVVDDSSFLCPLWKICFNIFFLFAIVFIVCYCIAKYGS